MKHGDIVKLNGSLGDVVTNGNKFYFKSMNYGMYRCSELPEITEETIEKTTFEEKIKFIENSFSWGSVIKTHSIGEYQIIEYINRENQVAFHTYINFIDNSCSYNSLDTALIGVIAHNKIEVNAARYATNFILKMLNMEEW